VERGLGGEVNQGENQTCPPLSYCMKMGNTPLRVSHDTLFSGMTNAIRLGMCGEGVQVQFTARSSIVVIIHSIFEQRMDTMLW